MIIATLAAIMVTMLLALTRALLGPTAFDRILGVSMFSTKIVLFIAAVGFLTERPDFLDLALLYALINFIGSITVLKFVRYGLYDKTELETEVIAQ